LNTGPRSAHGEVAARDSSSMAVSFQLSGHLVKLL